MSSSGGRRGPYNSVIDMETLNPREFYFDGIQESYVSPQVVRSWRGDGAAYAQPSDYRKTRVDGHRPGSRDRGRQSAGFAADITGNPWGSVDPAWSQSGGPGSNNYPALMTHDPYPQNLADPRTQEAIAARPAPEQIPKGPLSGIPGATWLRGLYQTSPIATLFFAACGVLILNSLFFRSRRVSRAGRSTGQALAAPAGVATGAGAGAIEGVNQTVKEAVEAVDDLVPGG